LLAANTTRDILNHITTLPMISTLTSLNIRKGSFDIVDAMATILPFAISLQKLEFEAPESERKGDRPIWQLPSSIETLILDSSLVPRFQLLKSTSHTLRVVSIQTSNENVHDYLLPLINDLPHLPLDVALGDDRYGYIDDGAHRYEAIVRQVYRMDKIKYTIIDISIANCGTDDVITRIIIISLYLPIISRAWSINEVITVTYRIGFVVK
jgi:hypothetical protein